MYPVASQEVEARLCLNGRKIDTAQVLAQEWRLERR
jgi:hypothetical protein